MYTPPGYVFYFVVSKLYLYLTGKRFTKFSIIAKWHHTLRVTFYVTHITYILIYSLRFV